MNMLNVLSIVPYCFLPAEKGGQKAIALFNHYLAMETKLTCIGTKTNSIQGFDPYKVVPLFSDRPLRYINPFYFFSIKKIIREQKISHLIIEHPYYGWLGYLLKKYCGVKLIVHSHNIEAERFKTLGKWWWKLLYSYERWTYRVADYVFFITKEDRDYAIGTYRLAAQQTTVITYGVAIETPPTPAQQETAAAVLREKHGIRRSAAVLLFNGAFNYQPNLRALQFLLDKIVPALKEKNIPFSLLICGKGVPESLVKQAAPEVIFTGFVDSIDPYLNGSTLFLNPVTEGGGIKTKLVEALAHGLTAVSFKSGARGVPAGISGNKLLISADNETDAFIHNILRVLGNNTEIVPDEFYDHFSWKKIIKKAVAFIDT